MHERTPNKSASRQAQAEYTDQFGTLRKSLVAPVAMPNSERYERQRSCHSTGLHVDRP